MRAVAFVQIVELPFGAYFVEKMMSLVSLLAVAVVVVAPKYYLDVSFVVVIRSIGSSALVSVVGSTEFAELPFDAYFHWKLTSVACSLVFVVAAMGFVVSPFAANSSQRDSKAMHHSLVVVVRIAATNVVIAAINVAFDANFDFASVSFASSWLVAVVQHVPLQALFHRMSYHLKAFPFLLFPFSSIYYPWLRHPFCLLLFRLPALALVFLNVIFDVLYYVHCYALCDGLPGDDLMENLDRN